MSNIDTFKRQNDLCLLKYDKYYYIGCIDLPQENWTIQQYKEWQYKYTVNLIALDDKFVPQQLSNGSLQVVHSMADTCYYWQQHYSTPDRDFSNFDFRELLKLLLLSDNFAKTWNEYFEKPYQVF